MSRNRKTLIIGDEQFVQLLRGELRLPEKNVPLDARVTGIRFNPFASSIEIAIEGYGMMPTAEGAESLKEWAEPVDAGLRLRGSVSGYDFAPAPKAEERPPYVPDVHEEEQRSVRKG